MRLGLFLPSQGSERDPGAFSSLAQEAEQLGFGSLWAPDHVLQVFGPILDPLTTLAFLAGSTDKIKLGTSVLVLPYRHPVLLANVASSLDVLSDGRMVLGVGAGWNAEEFAALGMSVRERGARTDEALEALRRLWSGESVSYDGRYVSFRDAQIGTPPRTQGGPPILVGGRSDAALRRALRFADGWHGVGETPEQILGVRERLACLGEEVCRDPSTLELSTVHRVKLSESPDGEAVADELDRLADAGISLCVLSISPMRPEALAWIAKHVVPRLEAAGR
jgi:probable F420-dependent oxidoreductase